MKRITQILKVGLSIIILALAVLGSTLQIPNTLAADQKISFTLSPMSQRIVLIPGETYQGSFRLSNPVASEGDFHYSVTVSPYSVAASENSKDDYGDMDFTTVSDRNTIMNWIEINNPTGVIPVNDHVTVSFTVKVPNNAPAGGQYAALMIAEDPAERKSSGNSATITEIMQMAHIIYAEVAGETVEKGSITENTLPSFSTNGHIEATSMVRNEGNVHTDAEYVLQVWPLFSDEEICTNEEDKKTSLIMPSTERYHIQTCDLPAVGVFRAKQVVRIFGEESTIERTIIVCPIWLMFVTIFIIVALIIWLVIRIRGHKKAKETED